MTIMEQKNLNKLEGIEKAILGQKDALQEILGLSEKHIVKPTTEIKNERRYVYGLAGIRRLFNVSHVTAQKYKDTIIADACFQQGRKIVVDVDKAMELFQKQSKKGGTI